MTILEQSADSITMQIMSKVFILGYIYVHPAYRDLMRAEGPKHIPISRMGINIA